MEKTCPKCNALLKRKKICSDFKIIVAEHSNSQMMESPKAYVCKECGYVELYLDDESFRKID